MQTVDAAGYRGGVRNARMDYRPSRVVDDDSSDVGTTGVLLKLYCALPPRGERLLREVDRSQLEEVRAVVEMFKEITVREAVEFEGELDEVYVGAISRGRIDNVMAEGFDTGMGTKSLPIVTHSLLTIT